MEKVWQVLSSPDPKKHSVRFNAAEKDAPLSAVYVSRKALGGRIPKAIRITIEEVEE